MDLLHPIACAKVTCCEVPDDFGLGITIGVRFGGSMCHLQLFFKLDSLCSYRMDMIWTPYLAGSREGLFLVIERFVAPLINKPIITLKPIFLPFGIISLRIYLA